MADRRNTTYTVRVTNSSSASATLDDFVDTLPSTPANATYVTGTSAFGGGAISDPVISGSALTWTSAFLTFFYGLPRTTDDIDYFTSIPANLNLDEIAGQDSPLYKKHKVWLHRVGVANLTDDYAVRLKDMAPGQFKNPKLLVRTLTIAFSKIERVSPQGRCRSCP